jgi:hypothetical protein
LTEKHDARISLHFVSHAFVEKIDHRRGIARELRIVFGIELFGRGIDIR